MPSIQPKHKASSPDCAQGRLGRPVTRLWKPTSTSDAPAWCSTSQARHACGDSKYRASPGAVGPAVTTPAYQNTRLSNMCSTRVAGMADGPTILHADLDAFYASVEQLLDPALRGRPIAVGGGPHGGVVLAASYEAKVHGVSGGMPGMRARQLCPQILFVRGHFGRYPAPPAEVMDIPPHATPGGERIPIEEASPDVPAPPPLCGPPPA